jgi:intracellular sulfur oxidation DsrE/DsrF family protein
MIKTFLTAAAVILGTAVALPSASWAQSESKSAAPTKTSAQKKAVKSASAKTTHKLAIQVAENNPQLMNLALNNARNVVDYYKSKGEEVAIEIVTFGPGLHMLRDDTSPVKQRIAAMALETPGVTFIARRPTRRASARPRWPRESLSRRARPSPGVAPGAHRARRGTAVSADARLSSSISGLRHPNLPVT